METAEKSAQDKLIDSKSVLLQAILATYGLERIFCDGSSDEISRERLMFCYDVDEDYDAARVSGSPDDEQIMMVYLASALEPDDCLASVSICFYTRDLRWELYYLRDPDSCSEADIERVTRIAHDLGLPPENQANVPESMALDYFQRIARYYAERLALSQASPVAVEDTPAKRKLYLHLFGDDQPGALGLLAEEGPTSDSLFFLKEMRDELYAQVHSLESGARLTEILSLAEAQGRVHCEEKDGDEYAKIAEFLKRHGYTLDIGADPPQKYRYTNVVRMLAKSNLPIEAIFY